MIRVGDNIPNISTMIKSGTATEWTDTHSLFKDKKILLLGLPGVFLVEYAASQIRTYDFYFDKFKSLGIDEIWFTSIDDTYVQRAWIKNDQLKNVNALPDPVGAWAEHIGMAEDMSREGLGTKRSHRYAMVIDNLLMKHMKYEDFTHNPMTCFQVTDADTMLKYFEIIQTNYERWNDDARDKVDVLGRDKVNTVLS